MPILFICWLQEPLVHPVSPDVPLAVLVIVPLQVTSTLLTYPQMVPPSIRIKDCELRLIAPVVPQAVEVRLAPVSNRKVITFPDVPLLTTVSCDVMVPHRI